MESGCSPSLRRPRTHANRKPHSNQKPRLWNRLFGEQQQKKGSPERKVCKKGSLLKKDHAGQKRAHGPISDYHSQKSFTQILKASHGKDRQRERRNSEQECSQKTMDISHGSSESTRNGSKEHLTEFKPDTVTSTKVSNNFASQGHDDSERCKAGLPRKTENYRRRVAAGKSGDDEDLDMEQLSKQKSYHNISWETSSARNGCSKANAGAMRNKELEQSLRRKSSNKQFQIKQGTPSFKADEILPDERACSKQEIEKRNTLEKSSFVPEAKSNQHSGYAQEITSVCNGQAWEEESSGEDAINGFNNPQVVQLKKCAFGNEEILVANKGKNLQLPTVRKSSRIPKKRVFDDDDEALVQRQKKRLFETELPVEQTQQKQSIDGVVNEQHANGYCGRESTGTLPDDHCANECNGSQSNNDADEPCPVQKKEASLTARQRALRILKEGGESEISTSASFPDILQRDFSKRHKENLTDAEQAIKKEEAAKRRKLQMEKNAKEIQAVAIQKILGQESSRKKREEKLERQRQEIEQEKQAAAMAPPVNSIRWVMGPSGNVVLFSQDLGLPKIFSGPCSYPQEREKCAGPSCNNVYKYRDSKTRLPLCSLQCYRAVQELPRTGPAF